MNEKKALIFAEHYIHLELDGVGGGKVESNLKDEDNANDGDQEAILFNLKMDVVESLVLAHACAGVNINDPNYVAGIQTTVEAIENEVP